MDVSYIGELLWPGQLGNFLVLVSFVSAIVALFSYVKSFRSDHNAARKLGNWAFIVHFLSMVGVMGLLYFLIFNHHYEYDYIRRNSNDEMPLKYLVSCFWAGQQGSFMLWLFWHGFLGCAVMKWVNKRWSVPMLAVFSIVQVIILSMLINIYVVKAFALIITTVGFAIPLYYIFKERGVHGWKAFIPGLALIEIARNWLKLKAKFWLILVALVPIVIVFNLMSSGIDTAFETIRLGISPFELTREAITGNFTFMLPDYLSILQGEGLNPLLENYWMVIHPPILFLGFASTLVPFAFVMAGLLRKDFTGWVKISLPWTVFSSMVLGFGIILGGVWAYESLSFGGFWAWDPVENASLVPWLILIAGLHTLLAFRYSGSALRITYVLLTLQFLFILYSTFLTRSGILGDSSVHSFTDLGMMAQLIILIFALALPAFILIAWHWRSIPRPEKEESTYSREFWMFIGSLVLLFSATHVCLSTSLPVYNSIATGINEIFGLQKGLPNDIALPGKSEDYYNDIQIFVGIFIALLSGISQFFKYKKTSITKFLKRMIPLLLISLIITGLAQWQINYKSFDYLILFFCATFAIIANLDYLFFVIKGKIRVGGASVAHIGFGLVLLGIIVALGNSQVISQSNLPMQNAFNESFERKNIQLWKNHALPMGDYVVNYNGFEQDGRNYYYGVQYQHQNNPLDSFTLKPHLLNHPTMGLIANPATKHYWNKDVFTHVFNAARSESDEPIVESSTQNYNVGIGDSFFIGHGMMVFRNVAAVPGSETEAYKAILELHSMDSTYILEPAFSLAGNQVEITPATIDYLDVAVDLANIDVQSGLFTFRVVEKQDWIVLKAIVFPFINLLWVGILLTVIGFLMSMFQRIREARKFASLQ